ncbi:MAG: hypothetical protein R3C46_12175 [Hyphomonadaceae bacterium]
MWRSTLRAGSGIVGYLDQPALTNPVAKRRLPPDGISVEPVLGGS